MEGEEEAFLVLYFPDTFASALTRSSGVVSMAKRGDSAVINVPRDMGDVAMMASLVPAPTLIKERAMVYFKRGELENRTGVRSGSQLWGNDYSIEHSIT